ncbi:hypothetical protein D3C71_1468080 [compost metagenome]
MASCSVSSSTGLRARLMAAVDWGVRVGAIGVARGARSGGLEAPPASPSSADRVSSAVATTSTPLAVGRLDRINVPSPKAMRALASASREVGAVKRLMFMLMHL